MINFDDFIQQLSWIQANEGLIGENDGILEDVLNRPLKEFITLLQNKNFVLEEDLGGGMDTKVDKTSGQALADINDALSIDGNTLKLSRGNGDVDQVILPSTDISNLAPKDSNYTLDTSGRALRNYGNHLELIRGDGSIDNVYMYELVNLSSIHFNKTGTSDTVYGEWDRDGIAFSCMRNWLNISNNNHSTALQFVTSGYYNISAPKSGNCKLYYGPINQIQNLVDGVQSTLFSVDISNGATQRILIDIEHSGETGIILDSGSYALIKFDAAV